MANQDNKNFFENVVSAQKQVVDTMVENTKKVANGNTMVNDTVEKGSEWYKNWLDNQKNIFSKTTDRATNATETVKDSASKMNEFYQGWFNTQMNSAKQMWEMNMNHMKNATTGNNTADMNPMNMWNNWMNQMQSMNQAANWMNQTNNWMNQAQNMNPMNMDTWKKASENWTGIFNQYYEMMNNSFADMQKNMQNGTAQDAYRNMVNVSEGFTRFAEMWTPMWKSIQEKTFNMDMYKQWANPSMYKDMMDKYFGFMPESSREYFQNMSNMMQNGMGQMNQNTIGSYQQMRGMMGNMIPNSSEMFGNMLNGYNTWQNMLSNATAPMIKMMTPNQHTKTMLEWNNISNRMMVYNIKNAELQYMIYNQGSKVMDQLAENIAAKMQNNEQPADMLAMYQEWLNISDSVFVSLFESEDYSKLMAEVSALQLNLKKDVEGQVEKMMVGIPVATRSEMDEMYKTIYELKKQVRQLEKMLEIGNETEEVVAEDKAAPRKTAKK
jgi:polyhydroxyalkanoate synthase subunit PhaE